MNILTNEELRLAIAKAKGIDKRGHMEECYEEFCLVNSDGEVDGGEGWICPRCHKSVDSDLCCPDWPTSIADAWELVEEMRPSFFQILLMCWDHTDKWNVQCNPRHGHDEIVNHPSFEADTAPRAICLAWLAWKEVKK